MSHLNHVVYKLYNDFLMGILAENITILSKHSFKYQSISSPNIICTPDIILDMPIMDK